MIDGCSSTDTIGTLKLRILELEGTDKWRIELCTENQKLIDDTPLCPVASKTTPLPSCEFILLVKDTSSKQVRSLRWGTGWAIHAIVFEFMDKTRAGTIQNNAQHNWTKGLDPTDVELRKWGSTGTRLERLNPEDRIVKVTGHNCRGGYLCFALNFHFESQRAPLLVQAGHEDWRSAALNMKSLLVDS